MTLYDITVPLRSEIAVWPGDEPYRFDWTAQIGSDSCVNIGKLSSTIHVGTHADAPLHFLPNGDSLDTIPLDVFVGPACVVDVTGRDTIGIVDVSDLEAENAQLPPRILFKTGAWKDDTVFPTAIPTMDVGLPDWLGARGVRLVGLDVPSVDTLDSKDLPLHHALYRNGIAILESLRLRDVPAGKYELIALPLSLVGTDGAPVRAILRPLGEKNKEEKDGNNNTEMAGQR